MLRPGPVAATPSTVLLLWTWAWVGAGGKVGLTSVYVWVRTGIKVGLPCLLGVMYGSAWRACVGAHISGSLGRVLCGVIHRSLSN